METAATHEVASTTGQTLGWATERGDGSLSLVTDNGLDLLVHVKSVSEARKALLEHRHQRMH